MCNEGLVGPHSQLQIQAEYSEGQSLRFRQEGQWACLHWACLQWPKQLPRAVRVYEEN